MILITGGSKSGRSGLAEDMLCSYQGKKIYIATMQNDCDEAAYTIERHLRMRDGKGFDTIECPYDINKADIPPHCAVLVEDAVNLLANEMFAAGAPEPVQKAALELKELDMRCDMLIVVTSQTGCDGQKLGELTDRYTSYLGHLNRML